MSKIFAKDEALLATLLRLPTLEARANMVRQLHPTAVARLCEHLKKVVNQAPSHRIHDADGKRKLSATLKTHKKVVRKLTGAGRGQKGAGYRSQKGGALIR